MNSPLIGGIMQIIIVGCGKVGRTLAEQLQEEESDITLIDVSSNVITSLQNDIDAMGIVETVQVSTRWWKQVLRMQISDCRNRL